MKRRLGIWKCIIVCYKLSSENPTLP